MMSGYCFLIARYWLRIGVVIVIRFPLSVISDGYYGRRGANGADGPPTEAQPRRVAGVSPGASVNLSSPTRPELAPRSACS